MCSSALNSRLRRNRESLGITSMRWSQKRNVKTARMELRNEKIYKKKGTEESIVGTLNILHEVWSLEPKL